MKSRTVATVGTLVTLGVLLGATVSLAATQRRVNGIITQVDPSAVSIQPMHGKTAVKGKLGAATKVTVDGHAASVADLKVTYDAKAELGLDDVWISVRADSQ
jgi:hypothetical protein